MSVTRMHCALSVNDIIIFSISTIMILSYREELLRSTSISNAPHHSMKSGICLWPVLRSADFSHWTSTFGNIESPTSFGSWNVQTDMLAVGRSWASEILLYVLRKTTINLMPADWRPFCGVVYFLKMFDIICISSFLGWFGEIPLNL
jgi:hypothetical protein